MSQFVRFSDFPEGNVVTLIGLDENNQNVKALLGNGNVIHGATGFTGSVGATGFTGSTGSVGFTGSVGVGYTGSQGEQGIAGQSVRILGSIISSSQLPSGFAGSIGDGLLTQDNGHLWVWDGSAWVETGQILGYTGSVGAQGNVGFTGSVGYTGSAGSVDGNLYVSKSLLTDALNNSSDFATFKTYLLSNM